MLLKLFLHFSINNPELYNITIVYSSCQFFEESQIALKIFLSESVFILSNLNIKHLK